jgi:hypothetical protein
MRLQSLAAAGTALLLTVACASNNEGTSVTWGDTTTVTRASGSPSEWCTLSTSLEAEFGDATADPAAARSFFDRLDQSLTKASSQAPAAIKSDVETFQAGFAELGEAFKAVKYNVLDLDTAVYKRLDAEMTAADNKIKAYGVENCGKAVDPADAAEADGATEPIQGTVRDQMIAEMTQAGLTADQATCVAEKMTPDLLNLDDTDPKVINLLSGCGVAKS